jgi:hypothetical protein
VELGGRNNMSKLFEELELKLDRLVDERMNENYASKELNREWVYEDFAIWLINKFKEERNK